MPASPPMQTCNSNLIFDGNQRFGPWGYDAAGPTNCPPGSYYDSSKNCPVWCVVGRWWRCVARLWCVVRWCAASAAASGALLGCIRGLGDPAAALGSSTALVVQ